MANERPSRNEQLAAEKRKRLSEIEVAYLRARDYQKSPQFTADCLNVLAKIRSVVRLGPVGESEALLMVGRLQQLLLDTFEHENVIAEFEGLRNTLKEMFGEGG